ncbi:hypothetical protein HDU80_005213 [Chytriomyces hyalinus]|nr:hypothetical protein HDU80_005213 [Chytriomyces hyalinus]
MKVPDFFDSMVLNFGNMSGLSGKTLGDREDRITISQDDACSSFDSFMATATSSVVDIHSDLDSPDNELDDKGEAASSKTSVRVKKLKVTEQEEVNRESLWQPQESQGMCRERGWEMEMLMHWRKAPSEASSDQESNKKYKYSGRESGNGSDLVDAITGITAAIVPAPSDTELKKQKLELEESKLAFKCEKFLAKLEDDKKNKLFEQEERRKEREDRNAHNRQMMEMFQLLAKRI